MLAPVREAADEVALRSLRRCADRRASRSPFANSCWIFPPPNSIAARWLPVGRFVREALAARVTQEAVAGGALTYLGPVAAFPGFPRALADTFEELRLNAVPLEQLRDCGESGARPGAAARRVSGRTAARGFADHATRVELARLADRGAHARETRWCALDLAPRTRSERELLTLDPEYRARASRPAPRPEDEAPVAVVARIAAALSLLRRRRPAARRRRQRRDLLHFRRGPGMRRDRAPHRRGRGRGVPFDQIAILVRSPERYQPLVVEGLRRAGIPAHCTRGSRRPDVAGPQFPRPAALRRRAPLRLALRRVPLARADAAKTRSRARPRAGSACWWTPR